MNKGQKNALDMFRRVRKFTEDTNAISGMRPGLVNAIAKLHVQVIDKIDLTVQKQNSQIEGVTKQKKIYRKVLNETLYTVTSGTGGYASSIEDLVLRGKMDYSLRDLVRATDEAILATAMGVMETVNGLLAGPNAALNGFGVDTNLMNDLSAARDDFAGMKSSPELLIELRKSFTQAIAPLVKLGKKILKDEADKAADTLMLTQKEWWIAYHNERRIISAGKRHTIIEGHMFAVVDVALDKRVGLYGGVVEATHEKGKVYVAKTDAEGFYKIVKVRQGIITKLKFVHADFTEAVEMEAFRVKRGKAVRMDVVMKKNN